jgi:hypothetical protein
VPPRWKVFETRCVGDEGNSHFPIFARGGAPSQGGYAVGPRRTRSGGTDAPR